MQGRDDLPVLWHLKVSNYNEKARWALDYKGVAHVRTAIEPGRHRAVARRLSGGRTLPILELDGEVLGDSTDIVAALERRHPAPPLYPADVELRRRALELEDRFDEQLGPAVRRRVVHDCLAEPQVFLGAFLPDISGGRRTVARAAFPLLRRALVRDFGIDDAALAAAREQLAEAGAIVREQAGPGGYLVGDAFSVADLTLAALLAPAVAPEAFPYPQPQRGHPALAELRSELDELGLLAWTQEMYARHRGTSAELAAAA